MNIQPRRVPLQNIDFKDPPVRRRWWQRERIPGLSADWQAEQDRRTLRLFRANVETNVRERQRIAWEKANGVHRLGVDRARGTKPVVRAVHRLEASSDWVPVFLRRQAE